MKQFDITYFYGPDTDFIERPEVIADIAAAGFTLVPINEDTETNKRVLTLLAHYGLRAVVWDSRIAKIYNSDDIAGADAMAREVTEDYRGYDNIAGWDIVDEPNAAKFPVLAAIVRGFRRYSPDKETVINLFPNYATPEQLGCSDFVSYLEMFTNVVDPHFISYDHYHFLGRENCNKIIDESVDERERLIRISAETTENRGGFFENIEDVRRIANKYGIDPMLIVLLVEHGPYRNLTCGELFWEANMCLAYGMRRISYFTYWEPGHDDHWQWTNAMCDRSGEKQQHYYDVKAINREIMSAGRYLFDKTSTAVFHIGEPEAGTTEFNGYGAIDKIDGENGVIGCFSDGSFYIVNRSFTDSNKFTLHSKEPMSLLTTYGVFVEHECDETISDNADRQYTVELEAGRAALIKF
ncbi:MAG: hypothetical protein HFE63_01990 [Clostridiales bacterium]|nr:hypothetical protein [Clostridiales bacterium]